MVNRENTRANARNHHNELAIGNLMKIANCKLKIGATGRSD